MTLTASVARWNGRRAQHLHGSWRSMPTEGILWVDISVGGFRHRLLGADGYWVSGDRYGCTYEDAEPIYGGLPYVAWEVVDGVMRRVGAVPPPEGVHVVRGIALPDDVWLRVLGEAD